MLRHGTGRHCRRAHTDRGPAKNIRVVTWGGLIDTYVGRARCQRLTDWMCHRWLCSEWFSSRGGVRHASKVCTLSQALSGCRRRGCWSVVALEEDAAGCSIARGALSENWSPEDPNNSVTPLEIREALCGATADLFGDLTQEVRARLEPQIPPQSFPRDHWSIASANKGQPTDYQSNSYPGWCEQPTDANPCNCCKQPSPAKNSTGFEVLRFRVQVLEAFRPRGATRLGQVISSPPIPSGGPFMTHLLPGGGVPRVRGARSPVPPRLPHFATPWSVCHLATVVAGAYPPRRPPDAWSPGVPAQKVL